jgi:hypothetical protein
MLHPPSSTALAAFLKSQDYQGFINSFHHFPRETIEIVIQQQLECYVITGMVSTASPVMADAVHRMLMATPEKLSLLTLNENARILSLLYRSSPEDFAGDCSEDLYNQLTAFRKEQPKGSVDDFLLRFTYRTLFSKARASREWIKTNFLEFDPLHESQAQLDSSLTYYLDASILPILNFIGLDNTLIRDRIREVLDAQMKGVDCAYPLLSILSEQPEFDMEYLRKAVRYTLPPNGKMTDLARTARIQIELGEYLVKNAKLDDTQIIRDCAQALLPEMAHLTDANLSGGRLLMEFAAKAVGNQRDLQQHIYRRPDITAADIGPCLHSQAAINFAMKHVKFKLEDLLEYVHDDLKESQLGQDLGL